MLTNDGLLVFDDFIQNRRSKALEPKARANLIEAFRFFERVPGKVHIADVRKLLLTIGPQPFTNEEFLDFISESNPDSKGFVDYNILVNKLIPL